MTYSRDQLAIWYWDMEQKEKHREAFEVAEGMAKLLSAIDDEKNRNRFMLELRDLLKGYGICPVGSPFYESYDEDDGKYVLNGKLEILENIRLKCDIDKTID